jgi:TonB family protein
MDLIPIVLAAMISGAPAGAGAECAIPGTALRLGMHVARVDSTPSIHVTAATLDRRSASGRFFGLPAEAVIDLENDRVRRVRFTAPGVSLHARDYVEDELRRGGLHRDCESFDLTSHDCVWSGCMIMHLIWKDGALTADVNRAPPGAVAASMPEPVASMPEPVASTPKESAPPVSTPRASGAPTSAPIAEPAMLPDTLVLFSRAESGPRAILIGGVPQPVYPPVARRAGIQGVVHVVATVDSGGYVVATSVLRGIRELDGAALAAAREGRFLPIEVAGRRVAFRVLMPFTFTLH